MDILKVDWIFSADSVSWHFVSWARFFQNNTSPTTQCSPAPPFANRHQSDIFRNCSTTVQHLSCWSRHLRTNLLENREISVLAIGFAGQDLGVWLNDKDIFEFSKVLLGPESKVIVCDPLVWKILSGPTGQSRLGLMQSWRSADAVLIPTHLEEQNHWALGVVDFVAGELRFYDSLLEGRAPAIAFRRRVRRLLGGNFERFDPNWKIYVNTNRRLGQAAPVLARQSLVLDLETPQQTNNDDCGVFVCYFMKQLISGLGVSPEELDTAAFRREISLAINHRPRSANREKPNSSGKILKSPPKPTEPGHPQIVKHSLLSRHQETILHQVLIPQADRDTNRGEQAEREKIRQNQPSNPPHPQATDSAVSQELGSNESSDLLSLSPTQKRPMVTEPGSEDDEILSPTQPVGHWCPDLAAVVKGSENLFEECSLGLGSCSEDSESDSNLASAARAEVSSPPLPPILPSARARELQAGELRLTPPSKFSSSCFAELLDSPRSSAAVPSKMQRLAPDTVHQSNLEKESSDNFWENLRAGIEKPVKQRDGKKATLDAARQKYK